MWDSTKLYLKANDPNQRLGIPHLAKNERDPGFPVRGSISGRACGFH
jgi:hypothetical protein